MGPPISVELNRMLLDINLGASTEDALMAMNERVGSEDLDLVVTAILIQRQTGGNLAGGPRQRHGDDARSRAHQGRDQDDDGVAAAERLGSAAAGP